MPANYRRIDTTDPRRYDRIRPFTLPPEWKDDSLDLYSALLSSATLSSGAAILLRIPAIAFSGLLLSIAGFCHDKPLQAKKETAAAGVYTGLIFGVASCIMITIQKMMGIEGQVFMKLPAASASA